MKNYSRLSPLFLRNQKRTNKIKRPHNNPNANANQYPDPTKWKVFEFTRWMSDFDLSILIHLELLGYIIGFSAAVAVWLAVASTGFNLGRIFNQEWWAVFPPILMLLMVAGLHEGCHFLFSNWDKSRVDFSLKDGAFSVAFRGEYHKYQLILATLAPTILISTALLPAFVFDSPYFMLIVIANIAGAGSDWIKAYLYFTTIDSRIWIEDDCSYIPIRHK